MLKRKGKIARAVLVAATAISLAVGGCAPQTSNTPIVETPTPTSVTNSPTPVSPADLTPIGEPTVLPTSAPDIQPNTTPTHEIKNGQVVLYDLQNNEIQPDSEQRDEISRQIGIINESKIAPLTNLSLKTNGYEYIWEVSRGSDTLPTGSYLQIVDIEGKPEIRVTTVKGAENDLNQFVGVEPNRIPHITSRIGVKVDALQLSSQNNEIVVNAVLYKKNPDGSYVLDENGNPVIEQIVGFVNGNGNWKRTKETAIAIDPKTNTPWIWNSELRAMQPLITFTEAEKMFISKHGGVVKAELSNDGSWLLTLGDGTVIGSNPSDLSRLNLPTPTPFPTPTPTPTPEPTKKPPETPEEFVNAWYDSLPPDTWFGKYNDVKLDKEFLRKTVPILTAYLKESSSTTLLDPELQKMVDRLIIQYGNPSWAKPWRDFDDGFLEVTQISYDPKMTASTPANPGIIFIHYESLYSHRPVPPSFGPTVRLLTLCAKIVKEGAFVDTFLEILKQAGYPNARGGMNMHADQNEVLSQRFSYIVGEIVTLPHWIGFWQFVINNVDMFAKNEQEREFLILFARDNMKYIQSYLEDPKKIEDMFR